MTRRSLQASPEGIQIIRKAIKRDGWKQDELKDELQLSTRQPITRLLRGEPIERPTFEELCNLLGLRVEDVAVPETEVIFRSSTNIDQLVNQARQAIQPLIQERCGTMRVLDMNQPIALGTIYTHVNILEKITGRTRRDLTELLQSVSPETFERFGLGQVREQRIPGLEVVEKYDKLMILGKPGAGKTTFLKHLAIESIGGALQPDRLPLFLTLKDFAEADGQPDLLTYLQQVLEIPPHPPYQGGNRIDSIKAPLIKGGWGDQTPTPTQQILENGRALILLDGLDEVRQTDAPRVLRQIQQFSERYSRNAFVITCRIAAREYTFERFTEVEVADFDDLQIADFAGKWFRSRQEASKAELFLKKLKEKPPIRELATSPLLLVLLCRVFEDSEDFPAQRSSLYEQGIEKLLREWNPHERELCSFYKELSPDYRQALLRYIAAKTFEKGNDFFKQQEAGKLIKQYIESLGCFTPRELLKLDSKTMLKTIEAQHGLLIERADSVYSFSHHTFHEYFTACEIVETTHLQSLEALANHITDSRCRWREVILLTVEMLPNADELLRQMKRATDELLAGDAKLQKFLSWVNEKSRSVDAPYKPAAIRSFYLALVLDHALNLDLDDLDPDLALDLTFDPYLNRALNLAVDPYLDSYLSLNLSRNLFLLLNLAPDLTLDCMLNLDLSLDLSLNLALSPTIVSDFTLDFPLMRAVILVGDSDSLLKLQLRDLYIQLPNFEDTRESKYQWWQSKGAAWAEELRAVMMQHRNLGHDWQFSDPQKQKLQQYYAANKLLVDCLNSDCYVSREVRQEIEATLLLPIQN